MHSNVGKLTLKGQNERIVHSALVSELYKQCKFVWVLSKNYFLSRNVISEACFNYIHAPW